MPPENQEDLETSQKDEGTAETTEATETTETTETESQQPTPEEIADLRKKADASSQNFERAKKAEDELKKLKSARTTEGLSALDAVAIAKADVHEDDIDEVVDYAKFKRITVKDALKSSYVTNMLKDKAEERRTAQATQTRGGQRTTAKPSGEELLQKAESTGEIPEDSEGMQEIFKARIGRKFSNRPKARQR